MQDRYIKLKNGTMVSYQEALKNALLIYVMWLYMKRSHDVSLSKLIGVNVLNKHRLLNEPSVIKITSIFNAQLEITKDMWAVSYLKKAHSEHGFLLIQSEKMFYRRDLIIEGDSVVIKHIDQEYDINTTDEWSTANIRNAYSLILWPRNPTKHALIEIFGKTWLIPEPKAQQLLQDTDQDIDNPPKYYRLGGMSLAQPGLRSLVATMGLLKGASLISGLGALVGLVSGLERILEVMPSSMYIPLLVSSGMWLTSDVRTALESIGSNKQEAQPFSIINWCSSKALGLTSQLVVKVGLIETDKNNKPLLPTIPNYHNCSTWIVEKLYNLKIKEIQNDLTPHIFDTIAYVTSFHLSFKEQYISAKILYACTLICAMLKTKPSADLRNNPSPITL